MKRVELRPTVAADFIALQGALPQHRTRCITAVLGKRVLGLGGLIYQPNGEFWASALLSPRMVKYPVALHRAGKMAIAEWRRLGIRRVFAAAEPGNPKAEAWLERFGFQAEICRGVKVYVWSGENSANA